MYILVDVIIIAFLCIALGGASIPLDFVINSNPVVVWLGNALGSVLSAIFVIYIANKLTSKKKPTKNNRRSLTNKIANLIEQGQNNKKLIKTRDMINKYGMRIFSLICPIFPGVLFATVAVYAFGLDKKQYLYWMPIGVVLVSGFYVFGFWFTLIH